MPGTWAWEFIAAHSSPELIIRNNVVDRDASAGETYRFLVMTGGTEGATVQGNRVKGLGPIGDVALGRNASELILTEAYGIRFEGKPLGLSSDGTILQIATPQGDAPATGDVVSILIRPVCRAMAAGLGRSIPRRYCSIRHYLRAITRFR